MTFLPAASWAEGKEGCFVGLPAEKYHASPGVSSGLIRAMTPTPAHGYAYTLEKPEVTPYMILGTLAHQMVLEPDRELPQIAVKPEGMKFSTKEGKAWRDEQQAAGKLIIGADAFQTLLGIVRSLSADRMARELIEASATELACYSSFNTANGTVMRRTLVDIVPDANVLGDIKTCDDASPDEFRKKLGGEFGYAIQAAYYLDVWNSLNPDDQRDGFVFLAVERRRPYLVAKYVVSQSTMEWGRRQWMERIETLAWCRSRSVWPGYPAEWVELTAPHWQTKEEFE